LADPSDFPAPLAAPPRVRHAIIGVVAALAIASIIGVALSPYLLVEHPVLLLALSPLGRHLALAVADTDPTLLVIVTVVRRVVGELASYGLGLVYGNAAVLWMEARTPKLGRFVRWVEAQFIRFGSPLLIVAPAHSLCLLAGAARVRFWVVALFLTLGEILWVIGTTYFGAVIASWSRVILEFFSTYKLESTLVCAVLVVARLLWSWRKRRLSLAQGAEPATRHTAD
jgi:uncharacterized membrane protein YdjX (TVP38/TMEM64 family)